MKNNHQINVCFIYRSVNIGAVSFASMDLQSYNKTRIAKGISVSLIKIKCHEYLIFR